MLCSLQKRLLSSIEAFASTLRVHRKAFEAAAAAPAQVAFVFDSISDMVLSAGFEATYKFVKQVNETTGNGRTSTLFLMTLGAHDEKVVSFIRSLFTTQLMDDAGGLRTTRSQ